MASKMTTNTMVVIAVAILLVAAGSYHFGTLSKPSPSPTTTPSPIATPPPEKTRITYVGWSFGVDFVKTALDRFEEQNPDIEVELIVLPTGDAYHDAVNVMFMSGQEMDVVMVELWQVEWIEAGWLLPLDDLPGAEKYNKQSIFPNVIDGMSRNGKLYGLPYYSGWLGLLYNQQILERNGISPDFETWEDFETALETLKQAEDGVPLLAQMEAAHYAWPIFWWSTTAAMGGTITDSDLNPMFLDQTQPAYKGFKWIGDAIENGWIDAASLESSWGDTRGSFHSGESAFEVMRPGYLKVANDPSTSAIAGNAKMTLWPETKGAYGWVAQYGMASTSKNKEAAWKLIQFMGGYDKNDELWMQKQWFLRYGLGISYPELYEDPEIIEDASTWTDLDLEREQAKYAVMINQLNPVTTTPWYFDWIRTVYTEGQRMCLGEISADEALDRIAVKLNELR